jgi:AcrR family transcriptional regulator
MASVPEGPVANKPRRVYRSQPREQQVRQTRLRILAAAAEQFLACGYTAATMRAIAEAAGVSVPTVELAFGTKPRLLKTAIDVAIAGDDEPVPVLEREWAARALATTTVSDFLAIVGQVLREAARRSAGLVVAAFEGASTDAGLRALADQLVSQRAATVAWIVDGITARSRLRPEISRQAAIDTVWLLMDPVVFQRLTRERGWSPEQFEHWFLDSVPRLLLECDPPGRKHQPPTTHQVRLGSENRRRGSSDDHG